MYLVLLIHCVIYKMHIHVYTSLMWNVLICCILSCINLFISYIQYMYFNCGVMKMTQINGIFISNAMNSTSWTSNLDIVYLFEFFITHSRLNYLQLYPDYNCLHNFKLEFPFFWKRVCCCAQNSTMTVMCNVHVVNMLICSMDEAMTVYTSAN